MKKVRGYLFNIRLAWDCPNCGHFNLEDSEALEGRITTKCMNCLHPYAAIIRVNLLYPMSDERIAKMNKLKRLWRKRWKDDKRGEISKTKKAVRSANETKRRSKRSTKATKANS